MGRIWHLATAVAVLAVFVNIQSLEAKAMRRDIVFLNKQQNDPKPPQQHPMWTQTLWDHYDTYPSGYRTYDFKMTKTHPVYLKLADQKKDQAANDQAAQSQNDQAAQAAQAAQPQAPAYDTAQAQQTAQPAAPAAAAPAAPQTYNPVAAPAQAAPQQDQPAVQQAAPQVAQQASSQVQNTQAAPEADAAPPQAAQSDYVGDCKPNCPKFECKPPCVKANPKDFKEPPKETFPFLVLCDDLYPQCGFVYSACNETWFQTNCPKRCGICKPSDNAEAKTIKPKEVKEMEEKGDEIESELMAPEQADHPLKAKYSIKVKPMLKNGVPQTQEIRILKPGSKTPLILLKQNITKPMIENIEIDVPRKGSKFSDKPRVEVTEGSHKEVLSVQRGSTASLDKTEQEKPAAAEEANPAEQPQQDKPAEAAEPAQQAQQATSPTTEAQSAQQSAADQPQADSTATQTEASSNTTPASQTPAATQTTQADANSQAAATTAQSSAQTQEPAAASTAQAAAASNQDAAQSYYSSSALNSAYSSQAQAASAGSRSDVTTCEDEPLCSSYTTGVCDADWPRRHCKKLCNLCS